MQITRTPTTENIRLVLETLRATPDVLRELQAQHAEERLSQPIAQAEWSAREVLVHLLNSDEVITTKLYFALLRPNPVVPKVHPNRDWGKLTRYGRFTFAELSDYLRFRRRTLLPALEKLKLDEKGWLNPVTEDSGRKLNVFLLGRQHAMHEFDHTQQLRLALLPPI